MQDQICFFDVKAEVRGFQAVILDWKSDNYLRKIIAILVILDNLGLPQIIVGTLNRVGALFRDTCFTVDISARCNTMLFLSVAVCM